VVDAATLVPWASHNGQVPITGLPPGSQVILPAGDCLGPGDLVPQVAPSEAANRTVCLWHGKITCLRVDAIVNAANEGLWPGGGVCGAIHSAAGPLLAHECSLIGMLPARCAVGQAVMTRGYNLPARHVLHTVGPIGRDPQALRSCYESVLSLAASNDLSSVALCCISVGIYGFPLVEAAHVALGTVRSWLDAHPGALERVVFVMFLDRELDVYEQLMQAYFPRPGNGRIAQKRTAYRECSSEPMLDIF